MIHVSSSAFFGREREYVADVLQRNHASQGHYVQEFERDFAAFAGTKYSVACGSGTAALHLIMLALGVRPGTAVLVPAMTYVATANAVRYCGGTPIFVDVDREAWTMAPGDVERARTRAIRAGLVPVGLVPVHLYGVIADMDELRQFAAPHGMWVVEDAAQAHGAMFGRARAGSLGDAAAFSFYGSKVLSCGEGGAVTTDDPEIYYQACLYRGQGMRGRTAEERYYHPVVGYNHRLTDLQAAVALAQVRSYGEHQERRRLVVEWYRDALEGLPVERQRVPEHTSSSNWLVTVLLPEGVDRDGVARFMRACGVETRPTFVPLCDLPMYEDDAPLPETRRIAARGLSLPTHPLLTETDVRQVRAALRDALKETA